MLYLKKIEMYGFKSFADKIELRFDQPITGIVGPNGCGKSNVSDAIRWVLGEQSTKTLRGKVMQDLIFGGTDSRKSMSYCEVSLFLDNTTRLFPIQMDEIIISRKLYRNNESEYSLNRNVVRLRDIQEMLRGVGLGKEGYSIVGQGRMDAVLNARPEDRRAIFEEALGISSFRQKKKETEHRLDKTRGNMENLLVVLDELKRQIDPLKRQSTVARKYMDLYQELRLKEINAYIYGYDNASQDKENCRAKIQGLQEEIAHKERLFAELNDKYDQLFNRRNSIDMEVKQLREQQLDLAVSVQKKEGQQNLAQERINNCQKDIEDTHALIAQYQKEMQEVAENLEKTQHLLAKRRQEKADLEQEIAQINKQFGAVSTRAEGVSSQLANFEQKLEQIVAEISKCNTAIAGCEAEKSTLESRLVEINERSQQLSIKLQESAGEEGDLIGKYEQLLKDKENVEKAIASLKPQIKKLEGMQFDLNRELQHKQQEYASVKGGVDLLMDFAKNYKGYQDSVKNLMQDALHDQELASHICGVVANLIKVEPRYQQAIEVALGARLQSIVTETEEDSKYLIQHLKNNKYGRATFLPVSSMKPHGIDHPEVLKEQGVLGIACDLVSFDSHYNSVFKSILGGIVVVDTYDNAIAISRKYRYSHRMVTLTGERIANDGSLEGGSSRFHSSNLLSYDTQISQKQQLLQQIKELLLQAEQNKANCDKQLAELRQQGASLADQLAQLNIDIATFREKIETSNTLNNSDKQSILGLTSEKEKISDRLALLDAGYTKASARLEELQNAEAKLRQRLRTTKDTLQAEMTSKDGIFASLNEKRYRLAILENNISASEKEIAQGDIRIVNLQRLVKDKEEHIVQMQKALDQLYEIFNESLENKELQQQMEELSQKINSADQLKVQLDQEFQMTGERRMELNGELENLRGSVEKEEYVLSRIDQDLLELQQRVLDEYGVTYSAAMEFKDENYNKEEGKVRISELKAAIQKLGNVNVNAIQDLEEVQTRYDDLSKQLDDMRKAEEDLLTALSELTSNIEVRFNEGMTKINDNFKTVFRELFNGGNARLYIDTDPTKASLDHGVEIEAQPPGKKLQNISLLSGGERTMTAAAILFAILKFNPMPFCVLDEIEAALDDANAERISKYLRKFSESTQFIVITHKKPTMENADVLYGVTMEEKGVSKIVSVKLTEAIKQAQ